MSPKIQKEFLPIPKKTESAVSEPKTIESEHPF